MDIKARVRLLYRWPLAGPLAAISVSDVTSKADTNFAGQDVRQGPEGDATYCSVIALLESFNEPTSIYIW